MKGYILSLIIIFISPSFLAAQEKKATDQGLLAGVVAYMANYGMNKDFVMLDQLLAGLLANERNNDKKAISFEEKMQAMFALGYIEGVYTGFFRGINAENFKQYVQTNGKLGDYKFPYCISETDNNRLAESVIARIEQYPKDGRVNNPTTAGVVASAFVGEDLYVCKDSTH